MIIFPWISAIAFVAFAVIFVMICPICFAINYLDKRGWHRLKEFFNDLND